MSSEKYTPIEHAKSVLGEHMTSYVILCVAPDAPNTLQIRTDNRYAALGMATRALDILNENIVDDGWEIVWTDENEEEI
tara:strand:- start:192 stop:428 length:237 start_codon:yes stop_codon:yes gene_type:complete